MSTARRHGLRHVGAVALLGSALWLAGCGGSDEPAPANPRRSGGGVAPVTSAPPAAASDARPRFVILGDSLTAGLGLDVAEAYPTLLQRELDDAGIPLQVVNAGISGDTTAGGLSRLELALEGDVRLLLVALGGNDALRALPVAELERNLSDIIERSQQRGIKVVLAGMEAPPNFGDDYTKAFRKVYRDVAAKYDITFIPFLLDGVAGVERLNQNDGIHPTAEGARMVADHVWPVLEPLARAAAAQPPRPAAVGPPGEGRPE
ncbi:MAG: arylesterase [Vicinamibacterales bacterium]